MNFVFCLPCPDSLLSDTKRGFNNIIEKLVPQENAHGDHPIYGNLIDSAPFNFYAWINAFF